MPFIQARAKLIKSNGQAITETSNILNVNIGGESTLELREGTFTTLSGGTLTFANGSSTTFTPGIATTYNVAAAQAGVANFKGTSPNYTVRGSSLVKVLKYPDNATIINHESSPNLIEVPDTLPPNVTNLTYAFYNCTNFNHPNITKWNTSNVTNMYGMFYNCSNFNQNINNWNVSKVINMTYMFQSCTKFNQDLSKWCVTLITSKPTNFNYNAPYLTDDKLPRWGTCPVRASNGGWYNDAQGTSYWTNLDTVSNSTSNAWSGTTKYLVFNLNKIVSGSKLIIKGDSSAQECTAEYISGGSGWTQNGPIDVINNDLVVNFPVGSTRPVKVVIKVTGKLPSSNYYNTSSYFDVLMNSQVLYSRIRLGIKGTR